MTQPKPASNGPSGIAIIGMAVALPGSPTLDAFWDDLVTGTEARSCAAPPATTTGLPDGCEMFDAGFFGLSEEEAARLDPQHRIFLETVWRALEDAGVSLEDVAGQIGLFAGAGPDHALWRLRAVSGRAGDPAPRRAHGSGKDLIATRVSHTLGLAGPALTLQAGCATGLVAVHQAVKALRDGDCAMALVGGVSCALPRGLGAGVVVLRRLDDALAEGDPVRAVIKGTGLASAGAGGAFGVPTEAGQAAAAGQALDAAGVGPESIGHVEGSLTPEDAPTELAGLIRAWRARGTQAAQACGLGAVQSRFGDFGPAASVLGLITAALALERGQIPPGRLSEAPTPEAGLASGGFYMSDRPRAWPDSPGDPGPRRAAVDSFGGGTHAHAVLEQAPAGAASEPGLFPFQPIVLSAPTDAALDRMSARLAAHLRAHPEQPLADVGFTLMAGRKRFDRSRVLVAGSHVEAAELLEMGAPSRVFTQTRLAAPELVFLFPGAADTGPGVGRDLFETEPVFHDRFAEGLAVLGEVSGEDVGRLWRAGARGDEAAEAALGARPSLSAPLGVILGVALAELAMSWGLRPSALAGVQTGEIGAAVVAGVMDFAAAVRLAHLSGRLAEAGPGERARRRDDLRGFACGMALTPPGITLFSARTGAPLTPDQACCIETWVSLEGGPGEEPDRLGALLETLLARPEAALLTLGQDKDLADRLAENPGFQPDRWLDMPGPETQTPGDVHFTTQLARAWGLGVAVDWEQFRAGAVRRRVPLPGYAFQRARHPIAFEAAAEGAVDELGQKPPERADDIADWGWRPAWMPSYAACEQDLTRGLEGVPRHSWLIFEDGAGIAAAVSARLEAAAHTVVRVAPGDGFAQTGARRFTLGPDKGRAGYDALFEALSGAGLVPDRIADFRGVSGQVPPPGGEAVSGEPDDGFLSQMWLAQALGARDLTAPVHVTLVTRGAVAVDGAPLACPGKAPLIGAAGAIARELPVVSCAMLDLEPEAPEAPAPARKGLRRRRPAKPGPQGPDPEALTLRLLEELLAEPTNGVAALRGARRYARVWRMVPLPEAAGAGFRKGGTYLITGGLGGLGLDIARGLVGEAGARVLLVDRLALPPRDSWAARLRSRPPGDRLATVIRAVEALEALGEVEVITADVTDLEAMRAVVTAATECHGRIDGVLHAAALFDDTPLMAQDAPGVARVFAPKVGGLRVLEALFPDGATDLMVLFSSTAPALRGVGELAQSAADAWLDACALSRRGGKTRVVSVGWGPWAGTGMLARAFTPADPSRAPRTPLKAPLLASAGFDADGTRSYGTPWEAGRAWVLAQHRVGGEGLMPLSGVAELAAEAFLAEGGRLPFEISGLALDHALRAPRGGVAQSSVRMRPAEAAWHFSLHSAAGAGGHVTHARADIRSLDTAPPAPVNLGAVAIRARHETAKAAPEGTHLALPQEAQVSFGPAWQVLRESVLGEGEGLARLLLPGIAAATLVPGMVLHPGLFDIASGWALELAPDRGTAPWIAARCETIRVFQPLPRELASWVRRAEGETAPGRLRFDVSICDMEGRVLVEVVGLDMRPLVPGAEPAAPAVSGARFTETPASARPRPAQSMAQGLAPSVAPTAALSLSRTLSQGIRPGEGFAALTRGLALERAQICLTAVGLDALIAAADGAVLPAGAVPPVARPNPPGAGPAPGDAPVDAPGAASGPAPVETQLAAAPHGGRQHVVALTHPPVPQATPVFLAAGRSGTVLNLTSLAQILGDDRPVYGLQAKGLAGGDPCRSVPETVASCLAEIREVQREGPYVLGGFAEGGIIALEIARALEAEGDKAALVVLLDSAVGHDPGRARRHKARSLLADLRHRPRALAGGRKPSKGSEAAPESTVEAAFLDAMARWEPAQYHMPTVLLRPAPDTQDAQDEQNEPDNGWRPHVPKLEIVEMPGDRDAMLLAPHVGVAGSYLRARIDAALRASAKTRRWGRREAAE